MPPQQGRTGGRCILQRRRPLPVLRNSNHFTNAIHITPQSALILDAFRANVRRCLEENPRKPNTVRPTSTDALLFHPRTGAPFGLPPAPGTWEGVSGSSQSPAGSASQRNPPPGPVPCPHARRTFRGPPVSQIVSPGKTRPQKQIGFAITRDIVKMCSDRLNGPPRFPKNLKQARANRRYLKTKARAGRRFHRVH